MLTWRGAGILVFFFGVAGFFFVVAGFSGSEKGTLYPWALAAVGVGAPSWIIGKLLNRRRSKHNTHDFMGLPMHWWGILFSVVGAGMLGFHYVTIPSESMRAPTTDSCGELNELMSTCGEVGAMVFAATCTQQEPSVQDACLACVRGSTDHCSPGSCFSTCGL